MRHAARRVLADMCNQPDPFIFPELSLFAFGSMAYELLAGRPPFKAGFLDSD